MDPKPEWSASPDRLHPSLIESASRVSGLAVPSRPSSLTYYRTDRGADLPHRRTARRCRCGSVACRVRAASSCCSGGWRHGGLPGPRGARSSGCRVPHWHAGYRSRCAAQRAVVVLRRHGPGGWIPTPGIRIASTPLRDAPDAQAECVWVASDAPAVSIRSTTGPPAGWTRVASDPSAAWM